MQPVNVNVKFKLLSPYSHAPTKATKGSAGIDLRAYHGWTFDPGERFAVDTRVAFEIPEGWEGQIRPRSGLAHGEGIGVLNSPGTIDSDYRGSVRVILINHGDTPFTVNAGDRIAQMVIAPTPAVDLKEVEELSETDRGTGGLGHTGRT